jgi:3-dehydroquinate dehydratase-2
LAAGLMPKSIYVLNGPNLNLLGTREPHIYGSTTLEEIGQRCTEQARRAGYEVVFRQTNHEGGLIDLVHEAGQKGAAVILNAGGLTHTSVALLDALKAVGIPVVECHLSNPYAREPFRHNSYVSPASQGVVMGFGAVSYELALDGVIRLLGKA